MNNPKLKASPDSSYNRSCDACRHHKIRCIPGTVEASKGCQRCEKMDRSCIYTAPQKRKQRKRTDTRVAELEREVQAMRNLFDYKTNAVGREQKVESVAVMETCNELEEHHHSDTPVSGLPSEKAGSYSSPNSSPRSSVGYVSAWTPPPFSPDSDVIDRGIITIEQARILLSIYNEDVVNHYHPVIVFSPQVTVEDLRKNRPTLFLSVIAAASGKVSPTLLSILNSEALAAYAFRTVANGEKSLELVQAMAITCVWYNPPGSFSKLKFYEYIHMAVTQAIDLGYGTNPRSGRNRRGELSNTSMTLTDLEVEQRKIFLICYIISVTASMSLRRPNMLRYSAWIDECLETLSNFPGATSYDFVIVAWARLYKIVEDINSSLSFEDLGNISNLSDQRTQMMVSGFEKALEDWKRNFYHLENKSLRMAYHHTQIFLHELSLHDDHIPEHFRPPFSTDTLFTLHMDPTAKSNHIEAICACICHSHSLLDIFLSSSISELRSVPVLVFVRMVYAMVVLIKIYVSSKSPTSKVGAFVETSSIKLRFYLEAIINKLVEAAGPIECRSPLAFLGMLMWIRIWYKGQEHEPIFALPTNLPPRPEACSIPPISYRAFAEDSFMNGRMVAEMKNSLPSVDGGNKTETFPPDDKTYKAIFEQEFEPFELVGLDPEFMAYNSDMNILVPTDEDFTSPNYDWGFPVAANGTV